MVSCLTRFSSCAKDLVASGLMGVLADSHQPRGVRQQPDLSASASLSWSLALLVQPPRKGCQAVIKSAARAASPAAWGLHWSAPAGRRPLAKPSSWRSDATPKPSGGYASNRLDHGLPNSKKGSQTTKKGFATLQTLKKRQKVA